MRNKIICLVLLCFFILTSSAFAASWSFAGRTGKENPYNLTGESYNEYVDKATVRKDGDILIFWHKQQFDREEEGTGETVLTKNEVALSIQKTRVLESYSYDYSGKEKARDTEPSTWLQYQKGSDFERKILLALKYAKEGKDTNQRPKIN